VLSDFYNVSIKVYEGVKGSAPLNEKTWTLRETTTGAVHSLSGSITVQQDGKEVTADNRIYLESSSAQESWRIKANSKIYEIVFLDDPMFRGHHIELLSKWLPNENITDYPDV
jgi:head-tail adaptor